MTSTYSTLTRWGNVLGVWLYRRSDGRITGPRKGTTIGLGCPELSGLGILIGSSSGKDWSIGWETKKVLA